MQALGKISAVALSEMGVLESGSGLSLIYIFNRTLRQLGGNGQKRAKREARRPRRRLIQDP